MNVKLEELKIKQDQTSKQDRIQDQKSIKHLEPLENEKNLKERIALFLQNSKKRKNRKKFVKLSKFEFLMLISPAKIVKMSL